jgi:hypothetical protein
MNFILVIKLLIIKLQQYETNIQTRLSFFALPSSMGSHENVELVVSLWDFRFSRRRVWSSESSGIYCSVLNWMSTDVSYVHAGSIIRAIIIIALMMKAAHTSEMSVDIQITRQYIPEYSELCSLPIVVSICTGKHVPGWGGGLRPFHLFHIRTAFHVACLV